MGVFIDPPKVKELTTVNALKSLTATQIEETYILPAEAILEQGCCLGLDTDGEPWRWAGTFDLRPALRTKYWADCKRAVTRIINRMAQNPHGYRQQSLRGAAVVYDNDDEVVDSIMAKWADKPTVFRT